MRALLLGALLACAACGERVATDCSIEQFVAADPTSQSCGSFTRGTDNYTDEAMIAAQRCVLNAIVNQQAFQLVYDADDAATGGQTPGLRVGILGTVQGGDLRLTLYSAYRAGGEASSSDDRVSSFACETIIATPGCKPVAGIPCLQCGSMNPGQIVCRG